MKNQLLEKRKLRLVQPRGEMRAWRRPETIEDIFSEDVPEILREVQIEMTVKSLRDKLRGVDDDLKRRRLIQEEVAWLRERGLLGLVNAKDALRCIESSVSALARL
jgi:hypothetical protein